MTNASSRNDLEPGGTSCSILLSAPPVSRAAEHAHDMKNCLSSILAITWLIERDASTKICDRLRRLRATAEHLRELVMKVDLVPLPSEIAPEASLISVPLLALDVINRAHDQATRANVSLELAAGSGEMTGDEPTLREALYNLVTNAIDATPPGGTVFVSTKETTLGDQQWEVRDTGCGIAVETMPMLGRAFHTTKVGGSGLGLALVQAAATAHGGLLRVESREGSGSTFTLLLPRRA